MNALGPGGLGDGGDCGASCAADDPDAVFCLLDGEAAGGGGVAGRDEGREGG